MAKILIDTCAIGQEWARKVLDEVKECPRVIFVESIDWKSAGEKGKMVKFHEFLRYVRLKYGEYRVEIAPKADVEAHIAKIQAQEKWTACKDCDDPHVFAIVRVKSVQFVLTDEKRMEGCRKKMQRILDQKYLGFRLINSSKNYSAHKAALLS